MRVDNRFFFQGLDHVGLDSARIGIQKQFVDDGQLACRLASLDIRNMSDESIAARLTSLSTSLRFSKQSF